MIETWFENWQAQLITRNLNFIILNNFVSAWGTYFGEYSTSTQTITMSLQYKQFYFLMHGYHETTSAITIFMLGLTSVSSTASSSPASSSSATPATVPI